MSELAFEILLFEIDQYCSSKEGHSATGK